jgi:antitoxin HigA-1
LPLPYKVSPVEVCELNLEDCHSVEGAEAIARKNPRHPGDFIRTEIIEAAGLSVTAAAAALPVSRLALSSLLNGKAELSGNMALRIEQAFGVKMDTLVRMQASGNIAQTRKRENHIHHGGSDS